MSTHTALPTLDLQRVSFYYAANGNNAPGEKAGVHDINWALPQGSIHCLVGRSGCGKTTLLKLAAGLLQPHSGRIVQKNGQAIKPGPELGYMFQAPTLLEWQRVLENVLLPVSLQRKPQAHDIDRAQELLGKLGLGTLARQYPRQLSGGQQSRVALARALILQPELLLLDEPFAALDAITRGELQDDLMRLCHLQKTTVLFVTHDIGEAVYLGNRVGVMHAGRMLADMAIELPSPRTQSMRHSAVFNEYCSHIFATMTGATA